MNNNKIFEPTLNKNCGKCTYSQINVTTLNISCQLGKKIDNTWVTAHNCNCYTTIKLTKKKTPCIQLDLFNQNNY